MQGEGANCGAAAVFVRFAGCNLWGGREEDRDRAVCRFCDTNFVGGFRVDAAGIAKAADKFGPGVVVLTGGEPLLQVDDELMRALSHRDVEIETNGTVVPRCETGARITVSPKANADLLIRSGHALKVVWPQEGASRPWLSSLRALDFNHYFIQPCDGVEGSVASCVEIAKTGDWRLSLQTHKIIGLP